jgi:hypothetical protein
VHPRANTLSDPADRGFRSARSSHPVIACDRVVDVSRTSGPQALTVPLKPVKPEPSHPS